MKNPLEKIKPEIFHKLYQYSYSFKEIVECELNAQNSINEALNNKCSWCLCPDKSSPQWGIYYEKQFRYYMNKIGKFHFLPGNQNSGEDLTCKEDEDYSIEHKTTQSGKYWNANSNRRISDSTKYKNPDKKYYYILVKHKIVENSKLTDFNDYEPKQTYIESIRFGMLSKNDWKNPNGTGAASLTKKKKEENTIEIWNCQEGFVIDNYFAKLDKEYHEYESEVNINF